MRPIPMVWDGVECVIIDPLPEWWVIPKPEGLALLCCEIGVGGGMWQRRMLVTQEAVLAADPRALWAYLQTKVLLEYLDRPREDHRGSLTRAARWLEATSARDPIDDEPTVEFGMADRGRGMTIDELIGEIDVVRREWDEMKEEA